MLVGKKLKGGPGQNGDLGISRPFPYSSSGGNNRDWPLLSLVFGLLRVKLGIVGLPICPPYGYIEVLKGGPNRLRL